MMGAEEKSLHKKIVSGEKILLVQIKPPKGNNPDYVYSLADTYRGKVSGCGVSDNQDAVGMSAIAAAYILSQKGIAPIIHMTARDRNRIALISDAIGAQALGMTTILCTSGTHQTLGQYAAAKSVFDIDAVHLLRALSTLHEEGSLIGEEKIPDLHPFFLGAVADPCADPLAMQIMRLEKKIAAGARFIITAPVFDCERFKLWWEAVTASGIHKKAAIITGIHCLTDNALAREYSQRRPSPCIPQKLLQRISSHKEKEAQKQEGIRIAVETIKELSSYAGIQGFELGSDGDNKSILQVIEESGL
ncbi:MAG: methylenetetrahydrofolate reductase [bacterium]